LIPCPRTDADDVELKASFQQLLLDLLRDRIETNVAPWEHGVSLRHCHGHVAVQLVVNLVVVGIHFRAEGDAETLDKDGVEA